MIEFKLEERKIDWRKKKKEKNGKGKILKFKKARKFQNLHVCNRDRKHLF